MSIETITPVTDGELPSETTTDRAPKRAKPKPKPPKQDPIPFNRDNRAPKVNPPVETPVDPLTPFDPPPPRAASPSRGPSLPTGPPRPLPTPPKFDFTDDVAGFFKYWASLSPDEVNRSLIYVYRNWPVWDPALLLTDEEREQVRRKELRLVSNIAKLNEPWEPRTWENEIYHRWGAGDYHLKLNDTHKAFAKTICMVTIKGLRDFDNFPPVLDVRAVVMSDPANASYIERMRIKGKLFPGDPGMLEEEMGAEAVKELTGTIDKLTSRMMDRPTAPTSPDPRAHAELKAVESVAEGAKQGMKIMGDAMAQAQAAQTKAADPKEYLRDLLTVAEAIRPAPHPPDTTGPQMLAFMQQMMAMQMEHSKLMLEEMKGRLAFTERTLQSLMEKQSAPPPPPSPNTGPTVSQAPRSFVDELERFMGVKDRLDGMFGGGSPGDGTPSWAPAALQGLGILASAATNITHNLAIAKTGVGSAIAPPTFDTSLPGTDPHSQDSDPNPQPPNHPQDSMNFITFAQRLHGPLINALQQGMPGQTFAAQMILHEGAMSYNYLAGLGKQGVLDVLQLYRPIWEDVIKVPQQFDLFLDGFLLTDEAHAIAEEMRLTAQEEQTQSHPHPPPTSNPPPPPTSTSNSMREPSPRPAAPQPKAAPAPEPGPSPSPSPQSMNRQPGETRRKVLGPNGTPVEVIAPKPSPHKAPTVNPVAGGAKGGEPVQ